MIGNMLTKCFTATRQIDVVAQHFGKVAPKLVGNCFELNAHVFGNVRFGFVGALERGGHALPQKQKKPARCVNTQQAKMDAIERHTTKRNIWSHGLQHYRFSSYWGMLRMGLSLIQSKKKGEVHLNFARNTPNQPVLNTLGAAVLFDANQLGNLGRTAQLTNQIGITLFSIHTPH